MYNGKTKIETDIRTKKQLDDIVGQTDRQTDKLRHGHHPLDCHFNVDLWPLKFNSISLISPKISSA